MKSIKVDCFVQLFVLRFVVLKNVSVVVFNRQILFDTINENFTFLALVHKRFFFQHSCLEQMCTKKRARSFRFVAQQLLRFSKQLGYIRTNFGRSLPHMERNCGSHYIVFM